MVKDRPALGSFSVLSSSVKSSFSSSLPAFDLGVDLIQNLQLSFGVLCCGRSRKER